MVLFLFFAYNNIDSVIMAISLASFAPVFFRQSNFAIKLFSSNILSHNNFNLACSLSSIEIKITPVSESNSFENFSLFSINDNQALCLRGWFDGIGVPSGNCSKNLASLYVNPSLPVLYGGSIYITSIFPRCV